MGEIVLVQLREQLAMQVEVADGDHGVARADRDPNLEMWATILQ